MTESDQFSDPDNLPAVAASIAPQAIGTDDLPVVPGDHEVATLAQMAVTIAAAKTAPKALQGCPNDVFMVLLTARDLGVGLTTAIREFHVIDGKVTLSPKVKLAMVKQHGHGRVYAHQPPRQITDEVTGETRTRLCPCGESGPANGPESATWHAERHDEPGILHSSTFTMDMARQVPAKENGTKITLADKSTWKAYPARMLSWRAVGYLLDDVFPEVGTGLYSPDELGAVTDENGDPIIDVIGSADPIQGTKAPAGHKQPPPPPATPEVIGELRDRIAALAVLPDARAALLSLWTAPREDGSPSLPPLDRLLASQVGRATAMVASIEGRARKGEWGEWNPPAPDAPQDHPEEPSEAPEAADAPEPAPEAVDGDPEAPESVRLAEMRRPELIVELEAAGLPTSGTVAELRARLAEWTADQLVIAPAEAES